MTNSLVVTGLKEVLADAHVLYMKLRNYHWNVEGPQFRTLHLLFEEQYNDLSGAIDTIAERIRALKSYAPGTFREMLTLSVLEEDKDQPNAMTMVANLAHDHEKLVERMHSVIHAAEEAHDHATADLFVARTAVHQEAAWFLNSMLK